MGKSALIRQFTHQLNGFAVLHAVGDRREADLPGAALGQLLAQVAADQRGHFPCCPGGTSSPRRRSPPRASSSDCSASLSSDGRAHTAGVPLYIATLLAEVPVAKLAGSGPAAAELTPPSLVALIHQTLAAVPPRSRALAEALAVLAAQVPLYVAGRVAGLTDP